MLYDLLKSKNIWSIIALLFQHWKRKSGLNKCLLNRKVIMGMSFKVIKARTKKDILESAAHPCPIIKKDKNILSKCSA